ncbi:hypothetical protein [Acinetobacter puyangensis]|uniref:hypothetical protein n=1 Tax=Acinetobacter puyangensis TaxID=1096779 RepID=UPI003A4DD0D8
MHELITLDEIIEDTINDLFAENDGTFDLTTRLGITAAAHYIVDYLNITIQPCVEFDVTTDAKHVEDLIRQRLK